MNNGHERPRWASGTSKNVPVKKKLKIPDGPLTDTFFFSLMFVKLQTQAGSVGSLQNVKSLSKKNKKCFVLGRLGKVNVFLHLESKKEQKTTTDSFFLNMFRIALTREIGLVPKNFRFSNALGRNAQMNVRFASSKMNVAPRSRITALASKSSLSGKEMVLRRNERSLATVAQVGKDWHQTPLFHYSSYALIALFPAGLLLR